MSSWWTTGGVRVTRADEALGAAETEATVRRLAARLDSTPGLLLSSGFEFPGRYSRYDIGYAAPPIRVVARGRAVEVTALNARGRVLLPALRRACAPVMRLDDDSPDAFTGTVPEPARVFSEEERTRQPSVFSVLRAIRDLFAPVAGASPAGDAPDSRLGLYGAFGYDLARQFEPLPAHQSRYPRDRDLVLHLPDEVLVVDRRRDTAFVHRYEFEVDGLSTSGLVREVATEAYTGAREPERRRDHEPGEYAALVGVAKEYFARGDLFEVTPSQAFSGPCVPSPSALFSRLARRNPAPFGFLANLGEREYLVGASPEMFVRVEWVPTADGPARRVETCPIAGTVARGNDPLEDAEQIRALLDSLKDESELTMCTDVDRNDKARVCVPGSVRVIGRRQIEMYSKLIHTVDHVEGLLRPDRDALDAFLTHVWAVTVTGAPKRAAMEFIEAFERSPRRWYGAAVGAMTFDGQLNTGLTLRTVHVLDGVATVRTGATLLHDSVPEDEERETELKASALLDAVQRADEPGADAGEPAPAALVGGPMVVTEHPGSGLRVLLVDHQDSFVHTLGDYFRRTGAEVVTYRHGFPESVLAAGPDARAPGLMVLSPGPGRPKDFDIAGSLRLAEAHGVPVFGVCLGLQGIAEALGGHLGQMSVPMHGKASVVSVLGDGGRLLAGLPGEFEVGRYHSLYAEEPLPAGLRVTARSGDGVVQAVEHETLPWAAVQFHPESIMTAKEETGMRIVTNVVTSLARR